MFAVQSSLCTTPPLLHGLACRSEAVGVSAGLIVCMRVVCVDTLRCALNQLRRPHTCAALALVCGCVVAAVVSIRSNWCNGLDASLKDNYPPIHFTTIRCVCGCVCGRGFQFILSLLQKNLFSLVKVSLWFVVLKSCHVWIHTGVKIA